MNKKAELFCSSFAGRRLTLVTLSMFAMIFSACGDPLKLKRSDDGEKVIETTKSLDGVKLISKSILRGDDERTFGQKTYVVSADSRLLLRFETLNGVTAKIRTDKPIVIRMFASDATEQAKAVASLRACPILKDWMMAATWTSAHPFHSGAWDEGSSIDSDDCVAAAPTGSLAGDCSVVNAVCFNVSDWYKSYMIERGINFGHTILSATTEPVTVLGDGSVSKGPRIQWNE